MTNVIPESHDNPLGDMMIFPSVLDAFGEDSAATSIMTSVKSDTDDRIPPDSSVFPSLPSGAEPVYSLAIPIPSSAEPKNDEQHQNHERRKAAVDAAGELPSSAPLIQRDARQSWTQDVPFEETAKSAASA